LNWLIASKVVAFIATIAILYFIIKELKAMIKRDKSGEVSKKCDLD